MSRFAFSAAHYFKKTQKPTHETKHKKTTKGQIQARILITCRIRAALSRSELGSGSQNSF